MIINGASRKFFFTDNLRMAFRKKRAYGGLFAIKTNEQLKSSL